MLLCSNSCESLNAAWSSGFLQLSVDAPAIDGEHAEPLNSDYSHFVTPGGLEYNFFKPIINIHSNLIVRAEVI